MSDTQKTKNRTSDTLKTKNRGSDKIRRGRTSQIEERSNRGEEHSNEPFSDDSDLDTKRLTKHTGKACRKRAKICSSRRYPMYNDGGPTTVLQSLSLSLSLSLSRPEQHGHCLSQSRSLSLFSILSLANDMQKMMKVGV
jgi:hypothetical protein